MWYFLKLNIFLTYFLPLLLKCHPRTEVNHKRLTCNVTFLWNYTCLNLLMTRNYINSKRCMLDHIRKNSYLSMKIFMMYKYPVLLVIPPNNTVMKRFKCYKTRLLSAITVPLITWSSHVFFFWKVLILQIEVLFEYRGFLCSV